MKRVSKSILCVVLVSALVVICIFKESRNLLLVSHYSNHAETEHGTSGDAMELDTQTELPIFKGDEEQEIGIDHEIGFKRTCVSCQFGENCEDSFTKSMDYFPPAVSPGNKFQVSYAEFKEYLSGLPRHELEQTETLFRNDETVGKGFRSWMNVILEHGFFAKQLHGGMAEELAKPYFPVLSKEALLSYKWLPIRSLATNDALETLLQALKLDMGFAKEISSCVGNESDPLLWFSQSTEGAESGRSLEKKLPNQLSGKLSSEYLIQFWMYAARFLLEEQLGSCMNLLVSKTLQRATRSSLRAGSVPQNESRYIAMHIRRGDSCERVTHDIGDADLAKGRPCYSTKLYFQKASEMRRRLHGSQSDQRPFTVLLITDSEEAIVEAKSLSVETGFQLQYLGFSRTVFSIPTGSKAATEPVSNHFIEVKETTALEKLHILVTFFVELSFAAQAEMVVGTSLSWVTRLLFLAIGGKQEQIPPFSFIDAPFVDRQHGSQLWWESALEDVCSFCSCPG